MAVLEGKYNENYYIFNFKRFEFEIIKRESLNSFVEKSIMGVGVLSQYTCTVTQYRLFDNVTVWSGHRLIN